MNTYQKATQPTIYFIGVTTGKSSIMRVFPKWAKALNLKDAVIKGFDFTPHSAPARYRECVEFIKNDPLSLGALVTTHKIDLYNSCKDLFEYLDPYAEQLGEISSISKRDGKLCGHAKDPISSGGIRAGRLLEGLRRRGSTPWRGRRFSGDDRLSYARAAW